MPPKIKICGLKTKEALDAAMRADFIGFVFYKDSPRAIDIPLAAGLTKKMTAGPGKVGLFVNPDDATLYDVLASIRLDMIQLHGDEAPQRVRDIAAMTGLPVMKAIRVAAAADIKAARDYEDVADWLLFDARSDDSYGGTGKSFDWTLLKDFKSRRPWMLSGGLNAANIGAALAAVKPDVVDVSSGVESSRGNKDPALIADFIRTVKSL